MVCEISKDNTPKGYYEERASVTCYNQHRRMAARFISTCLLLSSVVLQFGCDNWQVTDVDVWYYSPYLLEFRFSLQDEDGNAVVYPVSELTAIAKEDGDPVSPSETAVLLGPAANKELKSFLVLDYTMSMASVRANGDSSGNGISDAIENMEKAAKAFIHTLNEDAQVGIYEFHRDDAFPRLVQDFTSNKELLSERIDLIWEDIVQWQPGGTRCWDALYAAVSRFGEQHQQDERRFVIFLSDGADESSIRVPEEIIFEANRLDVNIYCIGFGAELQPAALRNITNSTGGRYYTASSVNDFTRQFQQIVHDLGGQYVFRWATLKRRNVPFEPSFEILKDMASAQYVHDVPFIPANYSGDVTRGILRLSTTESSRDEGTARVYLRTEYVPRHVRQLSLFIKTSLPPEDWNVSIVGAEAGGLCAGWLGPYITPVYQNQPEDEAGKINKEETLSEGEVLEEDIIEGYYVDVFSQHPDDQINLESALLFAGFGPLLRFDFENLPEDIDFNTLYSISVENNVYEGSRAPWFQIGWD